MLRVYTRTHVANVVELHPGGDRPAVHLVYGAVRGDVPPVPSGLAIAVPVRTCRPNPAPVRLDRHLDLREQALFAGLWRKLRRAYAGPLAANVSKPRPGRNGPAVHLICRAVRKDLPPIPCDLAVAVPVRTGRPQPAAVRVGRYLDLG